MRHRSFALFIPLLVSTIQAQDWPMYLKDLGHSSFDNPETRLPLSKITTLQPAWTQTIGATLASGVTISGGTLYFGDWAGNFNALNAATGSILWQTFIGKAPAPADPTCSGVLGVSSQGTVLGNTVYVGGGDSAVYALDTSSGKQVWRVPLADPLLGNYLWSSVVPYQNSLFVGIASLGDCPIVRGGVVKIDPQNPQQPLFRYFVPAGEQGGGVWSTPAIDPATNEVLVTTANGYSQDIKAGFFTGAVLKLDANTLANKAFYLLPENDTLNDLTGGSSPILFTPPGGVPLVAASQKNGIMYAVRRSDMSLAWQTRLAVSCVNPVRGCGAISTAAFDGATLFTGAGVRDPDLFSVGSVYALNPADGSTLWEQDTAGSVVAPITVANGLVFVSTSKGLEIYDAATGQFVWSDNKRGTIFSQPVVANGTVYSTYVRGDVVAWSIPAAGPGTIYSSSSASGIPAFAPNTLASTYGTSLNGATVTVKDNAGAVRSADVLFTSPGQVNYVIPGATVPGQATITVTPPSGAPLTGVIQVSNVAPGIFTANADGKGVAAAQAILVKSTGAQSSLPVFQCTATPGSCVAQPIDLGAATDQVFLILYGTGLRLVSSLDRVSCLIGGVAAPVYYAGSQNGFEGLDQANVQIPASLRGRGEVDVVLLVDGQRANTVRVSIK